MTNYASIYLSCRTSGEVLLETISKTNVSIMFVKHFTKLLLKLLRKKYYKSIQIIQEKESKDYSHLDIQYR